MTFTHGSYTVAWICYLPMEIMAAKEILDELHPTLPQPISDNTSYILGSASGHNVVVVCLSASIFRTNISTASSLSHFISTYTNIEFGLIFGIGGGIPRENFDIRLGDIVVSKPTNTSSGVIQYTYDETLQRGRAYPTGSPNKSSLLLPKVIHQMESDHMLGKHISTLASNPRIVDVFSRPSKDRLFQPTYEHLSGSDCTMCDQSQLVDRPKRVAEEPHIHYGLIASGKRVIRDGITRDRVARELDVLSFDWEAAGLIKEFPILVIRGICDYCDSHRGVEWQKYASLVAAIYAKTLLSVVPASQRELPKPEKGEKACLRSLSVLEQESTYHNIYSATETCTWLLKNGQYKVWLNSPQAILLIKGGPATGKSVLMKFASQLIANGESGEVVASFFVDRGGSHLQKTLLGLFRALLSCILKSFPAHLSQLTKVFLDREERLGAYDGGSWSWTEGELQQLISQIFTDGTTKFPVVLFVDGLDELDEGVADCARTLLVYFKRLIEDVKGKGGRLRICLSSRYLPILAIPGEHTILSIHMEDENLKDIQWVVADLLREITPNDTRQSFERKILSKAHGNFQHAMLLCNMVVTQSASGVSQTHILEEIFQESAEIKANPPFQVDDTNTKSRSNSIGETTIGEVGTYLSAADSGYSSLPTRFNKGHVQAGEGNDLHFHSSDADVERINNIRGNDDRDMDEVSIYTAGLDIHPAKKEAYISSFADNLLDKTLTVQSDQESVDRIHEALPGLLKTFALKVGSSETTQIYRDVMVFVRKYRREIARKFRDKYSEDNRTRTNILGNDMTRLQLEDRVSKWSPDLDFLEDPNTAFNEIPDDIMDDTDSEDMEEAERATDTLPEASIYKAFISGLPAFKCLLESIQNVLHRGVPGDVATNIKEQILEYLPSTQRVSRREAPQRHTVEFTAEWDLCVFLREQEYLENLETAMERAITITGSPLNAQAATTTQYMTQTWPSSGIHLLHVLKQIVRDNFTRPHSYKFPDGTHVCARCRGPEFTAEVVGIAESIAEFGEQLAWLASALRSSPYEMGITVVSAFISGIWVEKSIDVNGNTTSSFSCNIDFTMDTINDSEESLNGQCWHHLFRNPVIVKGYPIPRRPISTPGLEIALDTMAGLAGTHRINIFSNRIFIKEFSTMLIPTRFSENIISWHLLYKKNGDRISYLESSESHAENITLLDLEKSRHVLGWSSNVRNLAGTADANYMIERSWLRALHEDCRLKGIAVSQGRLIKSDHTSAFGKRDRSQQIARSTYRAKLYALSKRYVVLWDVAYKRGWLLNGTTALLHLLRASLEFNKTDDLAFAFLLGPGKLQEATNPNSASAAIEVLMNPENLNLELYDDSERGDSYADGKYRVRDRVNDLYETLDQIVDYQTLIAGEGGEGLKFAPRKDLEGWDFKDISTTEDPIYPCLAKLKTIGKGWVDLTRAIQAVSLFGRGFGSLIDPIEKGDTCIHWQALPSNKYYLAARMEDISRIMDRLGHPRMNPPRLTKSIVWYPVSKEHSMKCDCSNDIRKHCQLSHMTWPLHMSQKLPQSPRSAFGGTAAVVFGHNTNTGWIWNDVGDPEKGEPSLSEEESDDNDPVDSGIGSSAQSENITSIHLLEHRHYKIAIICALPKELMAVRALFDDNHRPLPQRENDSNTYALGRLGSHNVVAACLPSEEYGMNAASKVASDMQKSFAAVRWYFVVGIGGGVPSEKHDIRLGDVVVSTGVIQHDMGKAIQKDSSFQNTANLQRPARSLMTAISLIRSDPILEHNFLDTHLHHILSLRPEYKSPGKDHDRLFQPEDCHEDGGQTCENCKGPEVPRSNRPQGPHIHYGCIASGNQVIKDAILRDRLSAEMKVLCFEMEGAGVMTSERCLVIRGVCDYADSHKNDEWHYYAAATAAAYTKAFLLHTRNFDKPDREVIHLQKRPAPYLEEDGTSLKRGRYSQE